jgi:hypothetical protein
MMRTQRSSKLQQQGVFGAPTNQTYVVLTNATAAGDATDVLLCQLLKFAAAARLGDSAS